MSVFPRIVFLCVLLAAFVAPPAPANGDDDANPLDAIKVVAKAKFEAVRRTPAERAQALAQTVRAGFLASIHEFEADKITPEALFAWSPRVLEAELALSNKDADLAPVYERYWLDMREGKAIAEMSFPGGKITVTNVAEASAARLRAELAWLSHRGGGRKGPHATATAEPAEWRKAAADPLAERRNTARDQWEALQADPRRLNQERLKAARESLSASLQDLQVGNPTPDPVLDETERVFNEELALLERDADPTPLLERRWKTLRRIEAVTEVNYRRGMVWIYDLVNCRSHCLEAEVAWIRAKAKAEKAGNRIHPAPLAAEDDVADDARWARAKWEAAHADVGTLLWDRLQVARKAYRDADQEFQARSNIPVLLLGTSFHVLEAECAAAANPKEQAAALERYWERALKLEAVTERMLLYGKIDVAYVMAVRYARLEAEIWMAVGRPGWETGRPLAADAAPR